MAVLRIVIAASIIFCLAGCGGSDFEYPDNRDLKPGPGLFSGDDGVFTLIKKDAVETETETDEQEAESEELPSEKKE